MCFELALRKEFAKDLGVSLELDRGESRRRIDVLVEVSALVNVTAGGLGLALRLPLVVGLGLACGESRRRTGGGERERLFRYSSFLC